MNAIPAATELLQSPEAAAPASAESAPPEDADVVEATLSPLVEGENAPIVALLLALI